MVERSGEGARIIKRSVKEIGAKETGVVESRYFEADNSGYHDDGLVCSLFEPSPDLKSLVKDNLLPVTKQRPDQISSD